MVACVLLQVEFNKNWHEETSLTRVFAKDAASLLQNVHFLILSRLFLRDLVILLYRLLDDCFQILKQLARFQDKGALDFKSPGNEHDNSTTIL